jgi:phenylpropionate dioxygenase-like ring-hydroxylating dioxygenase large terminal subunit
MPIPIERYFQPTSLEEEFERIFWRRCFLAHESDVAEPESYFSVRLGRRNLTLRRFDTDTALFDNVCRHRFNLIDPPGFGSKPFRCSYHGWAYDDAGEVLFIPLRIDFGGQPPALMRYRSANLSGYIFKLDEAGVDGMGFKELIPEMGEPAGQPFHRASMLHSCNWKLMVENVLEGYHLSVVHPNTFARSGITTTSESTTIDRGTDSITTTHPHVRVAQHLVSSFPQAKPGYRHLYAFPNLFVSVTNDLIYFVSNLVPVSARETILHYRLFATRLLCAQSAAIQNHLKQEAIKFTETTLSEDKVVLETCQLGVEAATGDYLLGARELRIEQFHANYLAWI